MTRPRPAPALALAAEARAGVARAIALLEGPSVDAVERSAALLTAAVERMEQIQRGASEAGPAVRRAIEEMRSDLGRFRLLLGHAWEFRARCSGEVGYTRRGELSVRSSTTGRFEFEA